MNTATNQSNQRPQPRRAMQPGYHRPFGNTPSETTPAPAQNIVPEL